MTRTTQAHHTFIAAINESRNHFGNPAMRLAALQRAVGALNGCKPAPTTPTTMAAVFRAMNQAKRDLRASR